MERLQKVIAQAGIASRRKAEELITAGRVKVNGKVVTVLGTQVDKKDVIQVDNKPIEKEEQVYFLLNKPMKYICSTDDEKGRPEVTTLINTDKRIFPVGRLDYNSTGLLILTNDGAFANSLIHPSKHIDKTYRVTVNGVLTQTDMQKVEKGIVLDDGVKTLPAKIKMLNYDNDHSRCTVDITIFEGKNREIRRMMEALGFEVTKLHRYQIGPIRDDSLPLGCYRALRPHELKQLREAGKGTEE